MPQSTTVRRCVERRRSPRRSSELAHQLISMREEALADITAASLRLTLYIDEAPGGATELTEIRDSLALIERALYDKRTVTREYFEALAEELAVVRRS